MEEAWDDAAVKKAAFSPNRVFGIFFASFGLPLLVFLAWWRAGTFDPYSEIFFSKYFVEPTPEMPGDIRVAGWVFIAIGALLIFEPVIVAILGKLSWKQAALMIWLGGLVAAFGGAFFVAADVAEMKIEDQFGREI